MKNLINKPYFVPLVIFILNIAFKCINLTAYPVWYDECFGIFCFQQKFGQVMAVSAWDINPPFFPVMLWGWMKIFGVSDFSVRMFPAFFSALAAVLLYLFTKKFFNQKTALIASMLFLASDVSYFYAHETRAYTLILCLTIATTWVTFEMIREPKWWQALLLGVLYYCTFTTHFLVGIIFAIQGIMILTSLNKKTILYYIGSCGLFLLLFTHYLPRFMQIFNTGERPVWLASPSYDQLWDLLYHFNFGVYAFYLLYALILVSYLKMIDNNERIPKEQLRILVYAFLLGFGVVLANFYVSTAIPMFLERYLLFTLAGFILFLAYFIGKLPVNNAIVFSVLGVVCLYFMWNIDTTTPKHMDYRKVSEFVKQNRNEKTDIILQENTWLFAYYYDRETFKDYENFTDRFNKQYITSMRDSAGYKTMNTAPDHTRIILVQTYENFMDPDSTLVKRILKDYDLDFKPGLFEGANLWVFKKK